MTPREFIQKFGNAFAVACLGTGLFPSVKLAQAALESGWGKYTAGNNMFGIKASGQHTPYWHGDYVTSRTSEYVNGGYVSQNSRFRKYLTIGDSIKDHNYFLQQYTRYAKVFSAQTPEEQAKALQAAGYATDPNYSGKLISIINTYNLKQFDEKKKVMKWFEITYAAATIVFAAWIIYKNTR